MQDNYFLSFEFNECSAALFVDDFPMFSNSDGGSIASRLCINHLIRRGKNEFNAVIKPLASKPLSPISSCTLHILLENGENAEGKIVSEAKFIFDEKDIRERIDIAGVFEIKDFPFEDSPWEGQKPVILNPAYTLALKRKQLEIQSIFKQRDTDALMKEAAEKNFYLNRRYYLNQLERTKYLRDYFAKLLPNTNWAVIENPDSEWLLKSYYHGKIFCFELNNGKPPIRLQNEGKKVSFAVYLSYINNEIKWVL